MGVGKSVSRRRRGRRLGGRGKRSIGSVAAAAFGRRRNGAVRGRGGTPETRGRPASPSKRSLASMRATRTPSGRPRDGQGWPRRLDSTLRRFGGHVPAAPAISATIAPSLEPSAAVDTARMGATVTRPRPRRTVAGARSAAAGALMEASAAEDVIAAECCAGRKYRPFYKYFELHSVTSQLLAIYDWLAVEQELESRIYNPNYIAVS